MALFPLKRGHLDLRGRRREDPLVATFTPPLLLAANSEPESLWAESSSVKGHSEQSGSRTPTGCHYIYRHQHKGGHRGPCSQRMLWRTSGWQGDTCDLVLLDPETNSRCSQFQWSQKRQSNSNEVPSYCTVSPRDCLCSSAWHDLKTAKTSSFQKSHTQGQFQFPF